MNLFSIFHCARRHRRRLISIAHFLCCTHSVSVNERKINLWTMMIMMMFDVRSFASSLHPSPSGKRQCVVFQFKEYLREIWFLMFTK